ncbi:MAG: hypothetical protein Q9195_002817 [Heterodermia aff. obscurata]
MIAGIFEFATAIIGPLALIASQYHRRYIWHLEDPSLNHYLYVYDLPHQVVAPAPSPTISAVMASHDVFGAYRSAFMIFFGILIGAAITSALWCLHPQICDPVTIPEGSAVIELSEITRLKNDFASRLRSACESTANLWKKKYDDDVAFSWQQHREILAETVRTITTDNWVQIQDLIKWYTDQRAADKEEIQSLKEELTKLKNEQDRSERSRTDEIARKNQQIKEQHDAHQEQLKTQQDRSERSRSEEIARVEQRMRVEQDQSERSHFAELVRRDWQVQGARQEQKSAAEGHAGELTALKEGHQRALEDAATAHSDELAALQTEHEARIAPLQMFVDNHQSAVNQLSSDWADAERKVEVQGARIVELEARIAELEAALQLANGNARAGPSAGGPPQDDGDSAENPQGPKEDGPSTGGLPKGGASTENPLGPKEDGPSTGGSPEDGASVENLGAPKADGQGGDSELGDGETIDSTSVAGGAPAKKKRARKHRGVDAKGSHPGGMSAEERPVWIKQEAARRSLKGRITYEVEWKAVTEGLEGWNGFFIAVLIEEAKKVAKEEALATDNPQREFAVVQGDFESAVARVEFDHPRRPTPEEAATSSKRKALSWDARKSLLETYRTSVKRSDDIDIDRILHMTTDFNGTEIMRVFNQIIDRKENQMGSSSPSQTAEITITHADLEDAINEHKKGLSKYDNDGPAQGNETGDPVGESPAGNGPREPSSQTPAREPQPQPPRPLPPHAQTPQTPGPVPPRPTAPEDGGNVNQPRPQPANPQPLQGSRPVRAGYGVYTPPNRWPRPPQ